MTSFLLENYSMAFLQDLSNWL